MQDLDRIASTVGNDIDFESVQRLLAHERVRTRDYLEGAIL